MLDPPETHLAPYAIRSRDAKRIHPEPPHPLRSPFELDRHRIISSTAFRRLEQKTQVFAPTYHDHFRTRLTHTLEATHLARCLAVRLKANESLVEAITLAHDLGHPPFGHAGESALNEMMASHGGFNHNTHSLRVVDELEHPFRAFRGLNLTIETRAGLWSHETRYDKSSLLVESSSPRAHPTAPDERPNRPASAIPANGGPADSPPGPPSVEAQIASVADRIAYNGHDLEDAIGAGFVGLKELKRVALWQRAYENLAGDSAALPIHSIRRSVLDTLLDTILTDVIETSRPRLDTAQSVQEIQLAQDAMVRPSDEMNSKLIELEDFLATRVYHRPEMARADADSKRRIRELFRAYLMKPDALPQRIAARIHEQGRHRVVCDYLAGMTDRFCQAEYERHVTEP